MRARYGRPIYLKISWQLKKYSEEHRESLLVKNYVRCHVKNDVYC